MDPTEADAPPAPARLPEPASAEPPDEGVELDRRGVIAHLARIGASALAVALDGGAAIETLIVAPAKVAPARAGRPPPPRKYRYGMVIDTRRCVGCKACMVACKQESKAPPGVSYTVVVEQPLGNGQNDKPLFMTKPCFHCEKPPCTMVWPVGATYKRGQDGIVVLDYDKCIRCRYCETACPYGARYFDFGENYPSVAQQTAFSKVRSPEYGQFRARTQDGSPVGNVRKCTFCMHLQDAQGRYDQAAGRWPSAECLASGSLLRLLSAASPQVG